VSIQRYDFCGDHDTSGVYEIGDGEFVRYEDHKAEVERLRAELADARSGLRYTRQYRVLPLPAGGGDE
jgi:hypothetical protein